VGLANGGFVAELAELVERELMDRDEQAEARFTPSVEGALEQAFVMQGEYELADGVAGE
jgi:hypothetical protein